MREGLPIPNWCKGSTGPLKLKGILVMLGAGSVVSSLS